MSNFRNGKYRLGNSYLLTYPTLPNMTVQPHRVDLIQEQYCHDILVIEYTTISPFYFNVIKTGIPVKFEWTQAGKTRVWLGYASYISKEVTPATENIMQVHCVSASYALKNRVTRVFTNKTITEIAQIIAEENDLNFVGEHDTRKFEQLTITGHSYWEWLHEQAKKIGFAMVIDNTNLIFKSIDKLIDDGFSDVPILSQDTHIGPTGQQFFDRTLDYFKVLSGEHIEGTKYLNTHKHVAGIDPYTNKLIKASQSSSNVGERLRKTPSDTLFTEPITTQVTHSLNDAESVAKGHARLSRLNMPAKIRCQGDARFMPFKVVHVLGTGASTDGHWVINKVTHSFFKLGQYQVEMHVTTDGLNDSNQTAFRKTTHSYIGTVDISQRLTQNMSKPIKEFSSKLSSTNLILNSGNQGFLRTPTRWGAH